MKSYHLRCIRRILGIPLKDKVSNTDVLSYAGLSSMFTLLRQRRLRWLGQTSIVRKTAESPKTSSTEN